ncbi:MAG: HesA/MoeB/ThiF family protein [Bacillota bacterium]
MNREITFLQGEYERLQQHLFKDGKEQAACILCGLSETPNKIAFLVREVFPISQEHIIYNSDKRIEYSCEAYESVIKRAAITNQCFFIVHSHFNGYLGFSELDDEQESKLLACAWNRSNKGYQGSLVFNDASTFEGRVFEPILKEFQEIHRLKVVGNQYRIINSIKQPEARAINLQKLDRNIRAFGKDMQYRMADLHIGVIGCGGTGSALIEMLGRMGIGKITIVDHDQFDASNITRMHGTKAADEKRLKTEIMAEMISGLDLSTSVIAISEKLDNAITGGKLKDCDMIFSCLDDTNFTRLILNQLSRFYYIPLIDMGIAFDSRNGVLHDVLGRIDIITPDRACLLCREVIDMAKCASEMMSPEEYSRQLKIGYAKELKDDNVQSVTYNTMIASQAINEMLYMLLGMRDIHRNSHKVYKYYSDRFTNDGVNDLAKKSDCICGLSEKLGRGDSDTFLDMYWPNKDHV